MCMSSPAVRSVNLTVTRINEDNLLNTVVIGSILLAIFLTLISLTIFTKASALGIAAGAGIAIINFVWQRSIMQRVLGLHIRRPRMYALARYLLRLGITGLILYYLITSGLFSLWGLLVGLSTVVLMILICTVYFAIYHKGD